MNEIRLLSPTLINKIAAGEVVERPASIVKELIENSIDASASEITIKIEHGGLNYIEVIDNGIGMNETNAKLAFVQHATSKLNTEKDLSNILTMGFRGEALASISSVAESSIHTKSAKSEPINVYTENEHIRSHIGDSRNIGTTVVIKNIFSKIPARRKFLKSENTEYKYILDTFTKLALINHKIAFKLIHNEKLIYDLEISEDFETRISLIYPETRNFLIPLTFIDKDIEISGYIGHPSINRKDKNRQYIYVNSRPIQDYALVQAVKSGFGTNLMTNQQPVFFLTMNVNPKSIDVNVHPRKLEIRFEDPQSIFRIIQSSVRKTLEKSLQVEFKNRLSREPQSVGRTGTSSVTPTERHDYKPTHMHPRSDDYNTVMNFSKKIIDLSNSINVSQDISNSESLKFLQILKTYLLIEKDQKLLIIDQHAADERINYEKIFNQFNKNKKLPSQQLLIHEELRIDEIQRLELLKHSKNLKQMGFDFILKSNKLVITAVPELLSGKNPAKYFNEILEEFTENKSNKATETTFIKRVMSTMACHSSIRAGQELSEFHAEKILNNLLKCENPYSCPHGRPIIWELTKNDIEKYFKRRV